MTRWPLILGDEGVVTLVEVGDRLKERFQPGERYVIQPAVVYPHRRSSEILAVIGWSAFDEQQYLGIDPWR